VTRTSAGDIVRNALSNERVGIARHEHSEAVLDRTVADAIALGVDVTDPGIEEALGMAYAWCEASRSLNYAAVAEADTRSTRRAANRGRDALDHRPDGAHGRVGRAGVLGDQALAGGTEADRQLVTGTTAMIAAGAYEVQLDLIARLCLELPRGR